VIYRIDRVRVAVRGRGDLAEQFGDRQALVGSRHLVGHLAVSEEMHVPHLVVADLQRPRDAVQNGLGHVPVATLLEIGVPGGADTREHGHLLAPQPARSAPADEREAHVPRVHPLSPTAQEPAELAPAVSLVRHGVSGGVSPGGRLR
jgi:hypothetical protein